MTGLRFDNDIRKILAGDREGLRDIYEEYASAVYAAALAVVHCPETAEDVASEVFLHLWDKAASYRFGGRHKAWLMTMTHHTAVDHLRGPDGKP